MCSKWCVCNCQQFWFCAIYKNCEFGRRQALAVVVVFLVVVWFGAMMITRFQAAFLATFLMSEVLAVSKDLTCLRQ